MGFFATLFKGTKGFSAATNALLAEHMLSEMDEDAKREIRDQIAYIFRAGGFPNITDELIERRFNSASRFVQLNFIALALNDLGIEPSFKGEFWHEVRNPFQPNICDEREIEAVQARLSNQHKIHFQISNEPLNLNEL